MDKIDDFLEKIENKFDFLNKRITVLQDLVLNMKNEFDLINRSKIDNQCITELTNLSEIHLDTFLNERAGNCRVLDQCTTLVEKGTISVLNTYMQKGIKPAQKRLTSYIEFCEKYLETGKCHDKSCMDNAINIYQSLHEILDSNQAITEEMTVKTFNKKQIYESIDGTEQDDCKLLTPLSNETRLRILKTLSKGAMYYTQIEREIGIKGGHFHFHLDKLIEAGYVSQEEEKGPYLITTKGLKALKFLYELREELIPIA